MDIISSLPDPVLWHILSFLPLKSSVATSVLARRWRFLWTYVGNLSFEYEYNGFEPRNGMGFSDMVYTVLLLHNGSIDSLSILPYDDRLVRQYQIDAWISTAITRSVRVLRISDLYGSVRLPQSCFKCKTLVELAIERCTISVKPGTVCLPKLKKLSLLSNSYEDDESLPNLLSGCSAIENLEIEIDSDGCEMVRCCLCSRTLKRLVLKFSVTCYESDHEHKLVLDIPAVQYLRIDNDSSYIIWAEKLSSLVVADIWLSNEFLSEDGENIGQWRDTFRFLENLSNATSLTLRSPELMKLLNPTFSIASTMFHNLTKLKLGADWHCLTELLKSAYKLESLTIEKVEDKLKSWREPKHLPKCLLSSLKYVNIFGYAGEEDEQNMIRYILRHAKVLKRLKCLDPTLYIAATAFHNLTKLEVHADWHLLAELLEKAYRLESLVVQELLPLPMRNVFRNIFSSGSRARVGHGQIYYEPCKSFEEGACRSEISQFHRKEAAPLSEHDMHSGFLRASHEYVGTDLNGVVKFALGRLHCCPIYSKLHEHPKPLLWKDYGNLLFQNLVS